MKRPHVFDITDGNETKAVLFRQHTMRWIRQNFDLMATTLQFCADPEQRVDIAPRTGSTNEYFQGVIHVD